MKRLFAILMSLFFLGATTGLVLADDAAAPTTQAAPAKAPVKKAMKKKAKKHHKKKEEKKADAAAPAAEPAK